MINHGVETSTIEKMKSEIENFFNLPAEEKDEFRQQAADVEGYGQAFVVSEEQTLDWGDMFFVTTLPAHLRKPHLIPKLPAAFRGAIDGYAAEVKSLAMKILRFMAKGLGMEVEEMEALFDQGAQSMRMNYYPPCPQPELVAGLCPHSDAVGLTILLQVNEMEGLQIKKEGVWIPVSPLPDAFVINIGDILEVLLWYNLFFPTNFTNLNTCLIFSTNDKIRLHCLICYYIALKNDSGSACNYKVSRIQIWLFISF